VKLLAIDSLKSFRAASKLRPTNKGCLGGLEMFIVTTASEPELSAAMDRRVVIAIDFMVAREKRREKREEGGDAILGAKEAQGQDAGTTIRMVFQPTR
jgi:hypothetical protein